MYDIFQRGTLLREMSRDTEIKSLVGKESHEEIKRLKKNDIAKDRLLQLRKRPSSEPEELK